MKSNDYWNPILKRVYGEYSFLITLSKRSCLFHIMTGGNPPPLLRAQLSIVEGITARV